MKYALIALAVVCASPAFAAGKPNFTETGKAAAALSAHDFAETASAAGNFEVESSKLALERSKDAKVRAFAQMMITDHQKAAEKLKAIAPADVTAGLDATGKTDLDRLRGAAADRFDATYVAEQTVAHQKAVDLFNGYAKAGDNRALKAFAQETLPTLEKHLDHVKALK
jgi:putative membrane protein